MSFLSRTSRCEEPVETELVEKTAPTLNKVKENEILKQKLKITGREKWQK